MVGAAAPARRWSASDTVAARFETPADLRRIGHALINMAAGDRELRAAVKAARDNGRSWGEIAMVLGVTRQAARQRYGEPVAG